MDIEDTGVDSKNCPFCAEQIKQAAIKCKHCGEFLVDEKSFTFVPKSKSELKVHGNRNLFLFMPMLGAVVLHLLFCAESPLFYVSVSDPSPSLAYIIGYSTPGMAVSIFFLAPLANYFANDKVGKGFFKAYTLNSITTALYVGAAIRFVLFLIQFNQ